MATPNMEKFKSLVILVLIIASFTQIGILWNNQSHGLPINLIQGFLKKYPDVDVNVIKEKYGMPKRIIMSEGFSEYSIMQPDSSNYIKIYKEFKNNYISKIAVSKPVKEYMQNYWYDLIQKQVFIMEFSCEMDSNAFMWLFGADSNTIFPFERVVNIVLAPEENVNNSIMTVYVSDGTRLYMYEVNIPSGALNKGDFIKMITDSAGRLKYGTLSKSYPSFQTLRPDILIVHDSSNRNVQLPNIISKVPEVLSSINIHIESNFEETMLAVLLDQRDSFNPERDTINNALLITEENSYFRVYSHGLFEYRYLKPLDNKEQASSIKALANTLSFIEKHMNLLKESDKSVQLVLTGMNYDARQGTYRFVFNYSMNGYPIYIRNEKTISTPIENALVVIANNQRVVSSKWYVQEIKPTVQKESYNLLFAEIYNNAIDNYEQLLNENLKNNNEMIDDIQISYIIESEKKESADIPPILVFTEKNGNNYYITPLYQ